MNEATYRYGNGLDRDPVIELYHASTLGERRPVDDRKIMANMIQHATSSSRRGMVKCWLAAPGH
jgi:hypothetical protein